MRPEEIDRLIRNVPDFPKPGIQFKDITPVLASPKAFAACVDYMADHIRQYEIDLVVAIESRGFIFGAAVAQQAGIGLHLARKSGKLPTPDHSISYGLEYGQDALEMHSIQPHSRVALIDDVLATGGTAAAASELIQRTGSNAACALFLIELTALNGRDQLPGLPIHSLLNY